MMCKFPEQTRLTNLAIGRHTAQIVTLSCTVIEFQTRLV